MFNIAMKSGCDWEKTKTTAQYQKSIPKSQNIHGDTNDSNLKYV